MRRVEEYVSETNLAKKFKLYLSLVNAFIDYAKKSKEAVDEALWIQFLSSFESTLCFVPGH